jgi:hypothetical protein
MRERQPAGYSGCSPGRDAVRKHGLAGSVLNRGLTAGQWIDSLLPVEGPLHCAVERIQPSGSSVLLGARLALFAPEDSDRRYCALRERITYVSLHADPQFQETYVTEMAFPAP